MVKPCGRLAVAATGASAGTAGPLPDVVAGAVLDGPIAL